MSSIITYYLAWAIGGTLLIFIALFFLYVFGRIFGLGFTTSFSQAFGKKEEVYGEEKKEQEG